MAFQVEAFDSSGMHDPSDSRLNAVVAGTYLIGATVQITNNVVSGVRIRLNGSTIIGSQKQGNSGAVEQASVTTLYQLALNDYVEAQGFSGNPENSSGDSGTFFWMIRLS